VPLKVFKEFYFYIVVFMVGTRPGELSKFQPCEGPMGKCFKTNTKPLD